MVEHEYRVTQKEEFDLSLIADGLLSGRKIRSLQANYGISVCGEMFKINEREENERKYQKALKITERLVMMGCSDKDHLPYFHAADHMASLGATA